MKCAICAKTAHTAMCSSCHEAYDRNAKPGGGTILDAIAWAAKRARRFERERGQSDLAKVKTALAILEGEVRELRNLMNVR